MTRLQKRKIERNSKKKNVNINKKIELNILSIIIIDTKSILEGKHPFTIIIDYDKLNTLSKNEPRLLETIILVNFEIDNQKSFGEIRIIHEYFKKLGPEDVNNLIESSFKKLVEYNSKNNIESILNNTTKIEALQFCSNEVCFKSKNSLEDNVIELMDAIEHELILLQNKKLDVA
jgi:hypothetical protein